MQSPTLTPPAPEDPFITSPTATAYLQMYRDLGKQLVIKASGKELTPERLAALQRQMQFLTSREIYTILIFGGGDQITREWKTKHPDEPRPMRNGIGITTDEVLRDAVRPAYLTMRAELQQVFPDFQFLDPANVQCDHMAEYGWVGRPRALAIPQRRNVAIGFMGTMNGQDVNINADTVAQVTLQYDQAGEPFFLTNTGGVLDADGEVVPIILADELHEDGSHDHLPIDGGMRQKTKVIYELLMDARRKVRKAAMISGNSLLQEITDWKGSGSLAFHTRDLTCSPATGWELSIFDQARVENVASGAFAGRMPEAWDALRREQRVVRIDTSPLGGFSLMGKEDGRVAFEAFWAGYQKNGLGKNIVKHAQGQARQMGYTEMYAMSAPRDPADRAQHEKVVRLYEGYGFRCHGPVSALQGREDVPRQAAHYDKPGRDPYLFRMPLAQDTW